MRCGNCGASKHTLWQCQKQDAIVIKCTKCGNKSKLVTTQAKISIDWMKDQKGLIAVF